MSLSVVSGGRSRSSSVKEAVGGLWCGEETVECSVVDFFVSASTVYEGRYEDGSLTFDDAMELDILVPLRHVVLAELARAKLSEVLRRE